MHCTVIVIDDVKLQMLANIDCMQYTNNLSGLERLS